jgi:hypothetical protein
VNPLYEYSAYGRMTSIVMPLSDKQMKEKEFVNNPLNFKNPLQNINSINSNEMLYNRPPDPIGYNNIQNFQN